MIHFISGKPRAGKSLYGVRLVMDELIHGDRPIVTNLALNIGRINEYIQEKYPDAYKRNFIEKRIVVNEDFTSKELPITHITERIILLQDSEIRSFFTIRGGGVKLRSVTNEEWKKGVRPNFNEAPAGGVFYVIDEIHIDFNARAWADTGHQVLYYLSQHAKLSDDVIAITQHVNNVDKQFRSVAQDFTYIKNLSKQKVSMFRLPGIFMRQTYLQPATGTQEAMETGTFKLDVTGLASCYDTAKGVGIHGRSGGDKGARQKGFHWMWAVAGASILLWLIFGMGPKLLAHVLFHPLQSTPPAQKTNALPEKTITLQSTYSANLLPQSVTSEKKTNDEGPHVSVIAHPPESSNSLYCVGFCGIFGNYTVFLSDGTSVGTESGRIGTIGKSWVVVDGVRLQIKQKSIPKPETGYGIATAPMHQETSVEAQPIIILQTTPAEQSQTYTAPQPFGGITVTPKIGGQ